MPVNVFKDGFSYDGYGGGTEEWIDYEIISDISGYELDSDKAYFIEDIGFCEKNEVVGEKTSLQEIFAKEGNQKIEIYGISKNCFIDIGKNGELCIFKNKGNETFIYTKEIEGIYKLDDGNYSITKPMFTKVDLLEYFKDVSEDKAQEKILTLIDGVEIKAFKENETFIVVTEDDEKLFDEEAIEFLKSEKIYEDEDGEYLDENLEMIEESLSDLDEKDSQIENAMDRYAHPDEYRDDDDDYGDYCDDYE